MSLQIASRSKARVSRSDIHLAIGDGPRGATHQRSEGVGDRNIIEDFLRRTLWENGPEGTKSPILVEIKVFDLCFDGKNFFQKFFPRLREAPL